MRRAAFCALAVSAEVGSWLLLRTDLAPWLLLPIFFLAHGAASALTTALLYGVLPGPWRQPPKLVVLFLFTLSFLLPLVGVIGLSATFLAALYLPRRVKRQRPFLITDFPELPFRPLRSRQRFYTEGHLVSTLRHSGNPEERVKTVMAARQVSDQHAIPVLSVALKDPVDDVRLLAYAMIDSKERDLYGQIRACAKELEAADADHAVLLRRRLAESYWELAYLGLAQGDVLKHVLKTAREHAEAVTRALPGDGGTHLLLARVLIRMGEFDAAEESLKCARDAGMPDPAVLCLLAEVAFLQRRFDLVHYLLDSIDPAIRDLPPLSQVAMYWGCK